MHDFRARLIRTDMDRRLLEKTVEFARTHGGFDPKKLPKDLRVAMDSMPLEGAGRVEDTSNLLGHAARKLVECVATLVGKPELFTKQDFHVDMRRLTISCPAKQTERFTPGTAVEFDPDSCARCHLRAQCTMATTTGRTVSIAEDEQLRQRLRKMIATPKGRQQLRQRAA